jgi:hypothetical protein
MNYHGNFGSNGQFNQTNYSFKKKLLGGANDHTFEDNTANLAEKSRRKGPSKKFVQNVSMRFRRQLADDSRSRKVNKDGLGFNSNNGSINRTGREQSPIGGSQTRDVAGSFAHKNRAVKGKVSFHLLSQG